MHTNEVYSLICVPVRPTVSTILFKSILYVIVICYSVPLWKWCSRDGNEEQSAHYCLDPTEGSATPHTSVHLSRSAREDKRPQAHETSDISQIHRQEANPPHLLSILIIVIIPKSCNSVLVEEMRIHLLKVLRVPLHVFSSWGHANPQHQI